jgi:hypothetical protein
MITEIQSGDEMSQPESDFRPTSRAHQILSSPLPAVSPVFLYGTLMACPLLACLVMRDATQKGAVEGCGFFYLLIFLI